MLDLFTKRVNRTEVKMAAIFDVLFSQVCCRMSGFGDYFVVSRAAGTSDAHKGRVLAAGS